MRVRSNMVSQLLLVSACTMSGCSSLLTIGPDCSAEDQDLIPILASQRILEAHPNGIAEGDRHSGCNEDDPYAYAYVSYVYSGPFYEIRRHYERSVEADGWRKADTGDVRFCYSKEIQGVTAFLSVGRYEAGSEKGFTVHISGSHLPIYSDAGFMC
jgi:hypothetical protein